MDRNCEEELEMLFEDLWATGGAPLLLLQNDPNTILKVALKQTRSSLKRKYT